MRTPGSVKSKYYAVFASGIPPGIPNRAPIPSGEDENRDSKMAAIEERDNRTETPIAQIPRKKVE